MSQILSHEHVINMEVIELFEFFFPLKSAYFTLTAHLSLDKPNLRCSVSPCSPWLLYWTAQLWGLYVEVVC